MCPLHPACDAWSKAGARPRSSIASLIEECSPQFSWPSFPGNSLECFVRASCQWIPSLHGARSVGDKGNAPSTTDSIQARSFPWECFHVCPSGGRETCSATDSFFLNSALLRRTVPAQNNTKPFFPLSPHPSITSAGTPDEAPDAFELADCQCAALVTRLRAWCGERRDNGLPIRLVDLRGVQIFIEEDQQHVIKFLADVDRSHLLPRFAAGHHTPTCYLEPSAVGAADRVVASIPRGCEFDTQQAGSFVLGDLASDPEGFSG